MATTAFFKSETYYKSIISSLQDLADLFRTALGELKAKNPTWNPDRDARLAVFLRCQKTMESLVFTFGHLRTDLNLREWWTQRLGTAASVEPQAKAVIEELESLQKMGLVQLVYGALERCLRALLRALEPKACNQGTAPFGEVYARLLGKLGLLKKWQGFMDVLVRVRRTFHMQGVYFPASPEKEIEIEYRGRTYSFEFGRPATFVEFPFCFTLVWDFKDLLAEVVTHRDVASLSEVLDPFPAAGAP